MSKFQDLSHIVAAPSRRTFKVGDVVEVAKPTHSSDSEGTYSYLVVGGVAVVHACPEPGLYTIRSYGPKPVGDRAGATYTVPTTHIRWKRLDEPPEPKTKVPKTFNPIW